MVLNEVNVRLDWAPFLLGSHESGNIWLSADHCYRQPNDFTGTSLGVRTVVNGLSSKIKKKVKPFEKLICSILG